jgi:hypothetical protein
VRGRIGRRRADQHVLVVPQKERMIAEDGSKGQECDSQSSWSGSDSEATRSRAIGPTGLAMNGTDLAWMMRGAFPQNPEMAETAWESSPDLVSMPQTPLWPMNAEATMTPPDTDHGEAQPLLYVVTTPEATAQLAAQETGFLPWLETSEETLRRRLSEPLPGKLGCRCCNYLNRWRQTCGGDEMMNVGMWTYWKDPVESPKRLRSENRMQEHSFDAEQRAAFLTLLQDELDQGVVTKIAAAETGYISPSFMVKKKPGPDGKVKWRKV